MTYWLDLFTGTTWREFLNAGADVSGFRENKWRVLEQVKVGDVMLCYLTGVSRWVGALEVVSEPYQDASPIWSTDEFPSRVRVKPIVTLPPENGVPIFEMRDELSISRTCRTQMPGAVTSGVRRYAGRTRTESRYRRYSFIDAYEL